MHTKASSGCGAATEIGGGCYVRHSCSSGNVSNVSRVATDIAYESISTIIGSALHTGSTLHCHTNALHNLSTSVYSVCSSLSVRLWNHHRTFGSVASIPCIRANIISGVINFLRSCPGIR